MDLKIDISCRGDITDFVINQGALADAVEKEVERQRAADLEARAMAGSGLGVYFTPEQAAGHAAGGANVPIYLQGYERGFTEGKQQGEDDLRRGGELLKQAEDKAANLRQACEAAEVKTSNLQRAYDLLRRDYKDAQALNASLHKRLETQRENSGDYAKLRASYEAAMAENHKLRAEARQYAPRAVEAAGTAPAPDTDNRTAGRADPAVFIHPHGGVSMKGGAAAIGVGGEAYQTAVGRTAIYGQKVDELVKPLFAALEFYGNLYSNYGPKETTAPGMPQAATALRQIDQLLRVWYVILGLAGEAGEAANKAKKILRDGLTAAPLQREVGNVTWYAAELSNVLGDSFGRVLVDEIRNLEQRAANGTLQGAGDNR